MNNNEFFGDPDEDFGLNTPEYDEDVQLPDEVDFHFSTEEKSDIPSGFFNHGFWSNFGGGALLTLKTIYFFFKHQLYKAVACEMVSFCFLYFIWCAYLVIMIIVEYSVLNVLRAGHDRNSSIAAWVMLILLLIFSSIFYIFLFTVLDAVRKLSVITEKIQFRREVELDNKIALQAPTARCVAFSVPFGLLLIPEFFIWSVVSTLLLIPLCIPVLGVVVWLFCQGAMFSYLGLKTIYLRKGQYLALFADFKRFYAAYIGMGTVLGVFCMIPYFGFIALFFFSPVAATRLWNHLEFVKKTRSEDMKMVRSNDNIYQEDMDGFGMI